LRSFEVQGEISPGKARQLPDRSFVSILWPALAFDRILAKDWRSRHWNSAWLQQCRTFDKNFITSGWRRGKARGTQPRSVDARLLGERDSLQGLCPPPEAEGPHLVFDRLSASALDESFMVSPQ